MAGPGRPPGPSSLPKPPGSGRRKGSLDKGDRKLLTDKMAADLMYCYAKLGGRSWLLEYARDNPGEFIRQGLSRLFPAPQRDDPDVQFNQVNIGELSPFEAARRVAFTLAAGLDSVQEPAPAPLATRLPQDAPRWQSPDTLPVAPSLTDAELAELVEQQRAEEREKVTLENYSGSSAEQGLRRRELL